MKIPAIWKEPLEGYDPWKNSEEFTFDITAANRVCKFFERLKHGKGEFAGKPFILERWERKITGHLFGWKRKDGTRRYRSMLLYVPKKNGKTQYAAGLGLILLVADNEPGAEVYSASGDQDQAKLIYEAACYMVEEDEELDGNIEIRRGYNAMKYPASNSYWKVLSSEAKTKHGPNIHGLILDELHVFPNDELIETLTRGTVARRQPLIVYLTTADFDRPSVCNETLDYGQKVRDGKVDDPFFLPVIYETDPEKDDWTSEETWKKANPNYNITVHSDYFEAEVRKAKESSSKENSFKRLHLNMKTKQKDGWIKMQDWDMSGAKIEKDSLKGKPCFGGLDLSSTTDISAFALFFPEQVAVLAWFWVPEKTMRARLEYSQAFKDYLEETPGAVIDYRLIRAKVKELSGEYDIIDIGYDKYNASQLSKTMADEDELNMLEVRQGFLSMNEPSKAIEGHVMKHELVHFGNPVLRWMMGNTKIESDKAGNIKPVKPNKDSPLKIDGIIALVLAKAAHMNSNQDGRKSFTAMDDQEEFDKLMKEVYGSTGR